jgi:hypothetical protein
MIHKVMCGLNTFCHRFFFLDLFPKVKNATLKMALMYSHLTEGRWHTSFPSHWLCVYKCHVQTLLEFVFICQFVKYVRHMPPSKQLATGNSYISDFSGVKKTGNSEKRVPTGKYYFERSSNSEFQLGLEGRIEDH